MSADDFLDASGKTGNMFTGQRLGETYISGAKIWSNLPLYRAKNKLDEIIESLSKNQVTIISSGTGSGKTVIIPKICVKISKAFATPLKTCVTNPKTTTTISNAKKSAEWSEVTIGNQIGFLTKQEKMSSYATVLEYMTDGFLLGISQSDPLFSSYQFLCLDEVHERPVPTDFLLLRIKSALKQRPDLRLVLMSATINKDTFIDYFVSSDISTNFIEVSGQPNKTIREFWMTRTPEPDEYIYEAVKTIEKLVKSKPDANILVFVPTTNDCIDGCNMLKKTIKCYRLFSKADEVEKDLAISIAIEGGSKVVFATNLAESSITFSGLDYVVDTGKALAVRWDAKRNVRVNKKEWISKAQTRQRAGRVGREKPGAVYYLYTKELYLDGKDNKGLPIFPDSPEPRIREINPAEELLKLSTSTQHKGSWTGAMRDAMGLISPPTRNQIEMTEKMLSFYRIIGPVNREGDGTNPDLKSSDLGTKKNKGPDTKSSIWIVGAVGWAVYDIMRAFRVSIETAILILSGYLYGAIIDVMKIASIMEETDGDLELLWMKNEDGDTTSLLKDTRFADGRSDHIALIYIFDNFDSLEVEKKIVPKIRNRYTQMIQKVTNFKINRCEEIMLNWPWCVGNASLKDPIQQVGTAVLIARMFNAQKLVTKKKAKALFIQNIEPRITLDEAKIGDVAVCEVFTTAFGQVVATISTVFEADVNIRDCFSRTGRKNAYTI
jgi:HrpA-like RNA helicase